MPLILHDRELSQRQCAMLTRLRAWGLPVSGIAQELGVSRQYVWQVLHNRLPVSARRFGEIERAVEERIQCERLHASAGQRLRRARIAAGFTLKQAASAIGYSWVAVERWERNACLPKPGVLWHLRHVYGVGEDWTLTRMPDEGAIDQGRSGAARRHVASLSGSAEERTCIQKPHEPSPPKSRPARRL